MLNIEFFERSIFYNISLFNLGFAFVLLFAGMRMVDSLQDDRPVLVQATLLAIFHQYIFLPVFALLFVLWFQPCAEVCLSIFILVSLPNNRFSIVISWLAGGSIALAVVLSLISILFSLTLTPFIFFTLMSWNTTTQALMVAHSYADFVELLWQNRIEFFLMIVPAIALGMLLRKPYKAFIHTIEDKVRWISVFFMLTFMLIIFAQRQDYFMLYWEFFSWEVFLYNISVLCLSVLWTKIFRFSYALSMSFALSASINFMAIATLVILAWYPLHKQALWFVSVQAAVTHWLFLIGALAWHYLKPCLSQRRSVP